MLLVAFFGWWYSIGWLMVMRKTGAKALGILQFFSIDQLFGSLFAPFRQISAGPVRGPLGVQLQALGDRLLSRVIGAIVRSLLIIVGSAAALAYVVFGLVMMLVWPFLPALPLLGLMVMLSGYLP
jgi:hypothetical protein